MQTKEKALKKIKSLVKKFDEQKEFYKQADYNETQTRIDFIDPFFKALGWDVDNENAYAESYREVIHEDRVKVGTATKAPDYSFRLVGGKRLFFLEAKKPSIDIKEDINPAYQIRRYGWSAKMPISIITDFEEFSIYDCTVKPKPTDKASNSRIKYLQYTDYIIEFDFIWDTFSKENVLKGSFDKFIAKYKNKQGTSSVDNEFLKSIDKWRVDLAMNIALRNKNIGEEELNFIVQNTIDRIIFLRIAEDRSVEPYGDLKTDIIKGNFYNNLIYRFNRANQKYNSGLFDFEKDNISTKIIIDNKIIKEIISELYYPICPYEFSVLPVEILGSAYEQFLGKKISLTKTGRARIQEKSEVRKAGGVYYTPQYIVDYIVENTIGKIIQGKTPKEVTDIKICDPACGSGSFLIGAYQFLLDWHKDYYSNKGKISKGEKNNPLTPLGELTTAEKKRILLNNIYGVDLDNNAVEVTKLSLLLKCMEGETKATIETELKLFQDRVLPTLDNNIKCGNSLIDLDYYENELDFGEERKIKPFSWEKSFPEVFNRKILKEKKEDLESLIKKTKHHAQKALDYATEMEEKINKVSESEPNYELNGGFDVIIGNPPYVQTSVIDKASHKYLSKKFKANNDLYSMFIEQSLKLLKQENDLGFILPSLFLKGVRYQSLRNIVNIHSKNVIIKEQGDKVFKNVKMPTCIILIKKGKNNRKKDFFINENFKYFNKIKTIPLGTISETKRGLEIGRNKLNDIGNIKCLVGGNIDVYTTKDGKFIDEKTYKVFSKKDEIFKSPKIIVRETGNKFFANIDYDHLITTRSIYNTRIINKNYSAELILAIINSSLFKFYFKQFISPETNIFPKIRIAQLKELPIPQQVNKTKNQEIEKLVSQIIQLNKDKKDLNLPNQIELTENRIKYIEEKINKIIFELYGLNEEEIEIIKN